MPATKKPLSFAAAAAAKAMERKLKLWPAGPEREEMRELFKPIGQKMREAKAAHRKEVMSWPQARRQEIYAAIYSGITLGEVAKKFEIDMVLVTTVLLINQKKNVFYTRNDVSI